MVIEFPRDPIDVQDQQTTDSQKPADTLKKPIHQNPVPTRDPQTKRIMGLIPNFRSVSTDEKLPPMTVKEKFLTATDDSFDYSSVFIPAMLAGVSMARKATPEFGQGAVGYGRYFWHSALDQTSAECRKISAVADRALSELCVSPASPSRRLPASPE